MTTTPTSPIAILFSGAGDDAASPADPDQDRAVDAALAAFLDFGIRRTSMGEIARRAGISPATLYRWFGGKDDVVRAVFQREARHFVAGLDAAVGSHVPPAEQLTEIAVVVASRLRDQPLLRRLRATEPAEVLLQLTDKGGPFIEAGTAFLALRIDRLMNDGLVSRFDPVPLAEVLTRVAHSLLLTPSTALPLDDDAGLRTVVGDIVRRLLRLPDPEGTST
jgi:AcrR family transcriptional regulator